MNLRALLMAVFTLLCAAMLGLAAGACWMVMTLYLRHPAPWLALPAGVLLAWAMRHWVHRPGKVAAALAALATLLAATYVSVLIAGVLIAGNMGMGLLDALRTAGGGMLLQLARLGLSPTNAGWFAAGAALAAFIAGRPARAPTPP